MAQKHLRKVKQAAGEISAARRRFELAVMEAHESGETYRDIAQWAGVSHQTIHQIVKDARVGDNG